MLLLDLSSRSGVTVESSHQVTSKTTSRCQWAPTPSQFIRLLIGSESRYGVQQDSERSCHCQRIIMPGESTESWSALLPGRQPRRSLSLHTRASCVPSTIKVCLEEILSGHVSSIISASLLSIMRPWKAVGDVVCLKAFAGGSRYRWSPNRPHLCR